jgi:hypothetical protein
MRANMKKLAVLAGVFIIAIFMTVATASALGKWSRSIHGKFAVTGSNACLTAFPPGFDEDLQPIDFSAPINMQTWEGEYTFKPNGKGVLDVVAHDVGVSPPKGGGGSVTVHWDFNYTVNYEGKITFTLVPGSYIGEWLTGTQAGQFVYLDIKDSWGGVISPDGNHIFVTWGAPLILYLLDKQGGEPIGVQLICNGSFVLFRLK